MTSENIKQAGSEQQPQPQSSHDIPTTTDSEIAWAPEMAVPVVYTAPMGVRRHKGLVKFFNAQKGFGFIVPDDKSIVNVNGKNELFVHHTAIINAGGFRSLAENERVEYEIVDGPKGIQAANVTGPDGRSPFGTPPPAKVGQHMHAIMTKHLNVAHYMPSPYPHYPHSAASSISPSHLYPYFGPYVPLESIAASNPSSSQDPDYSMNDEDLNY